MNDELKFQVIAGNSINDELKSVQAEINISTRNLQEEAMLVALIRNGNSWIKANHIIRVNKNSCDNITIYPRDLKIDKRMLI